ncbi:hypothetical protein FDP41_009442 [Naegleria fowleri]|uniref:Uncharacterized protein n=1 Tax=Naegleria fowleri TaxID=5763 RepID=A0A6A5BHN7_NAEFO|nr:uncharacterized protein FDP41_009442 [Naegleria fowleri]KAF0972539.1 hypothetical protein FDP41_009442 [Naegleria fowleri]
MNADTLYGSRVVSELDCIIFFFKSRKLANQAISAGAKSKLTMIPQTVKTSFRYKVDKDLDKTNMHSIISTLGSSINNINFSKMDDQEFWAIGTNIELPANHLKKFKLSKMRTDISRFRIAFNGKEKIFLNSRVPLVPNGKSRLRVSSWLRRWLLLVLKRSNYQ